jgi:hypothetical protein
VRRCLLVAAALESTEEISEGCARSPQKAGFTQRFAEVRKRRFLRCHLYIKCIILPRQARDKHRKNSKTDCRFLPGEMRGTDRPGWFALRSCVLACLLACLLCRRCTAVHHCPVGSCAVRFCSSVCLPQRPACSRAWLARQLCLPASVRRLPDKKRETSICHLAAGCRARR